MPSLSDRLKALGVEVGADHLQPNKTAPRGRKYPIETLTEGETISTPMGDIYQVVASYPMQHPHGITALELTAPLDLVAEWAGEPRIAGHTPDQFAFIDNETTGLAGGSGTYAFMVGAGRFEEDGFRLVQFFLRDPAEEPALLHALEHFLAPAETIVSFNGKSYDMPLLQARYITNSQPYPFKNAAQLDLLHLARRLWRQRLPSRTLTYLEEHILGQTRTGEDTPGWMIPQLYFDYLRSGDARPLKGVFYHNAMDILTLAALTNHVAHLLAEPLDGRVEYTLDLAAIGKLNQDLGYLDRAAHIYEHCLEQDLEKDLQQQTIERLSMLQKKRGEMPLAVSLWWQAAADRQIYAHEELAKYFEHTEKNYPEAIRWTEAALAILAMPGTPFADKLQWEDSLHHRLARLQKKAEKSD